MMTKPSKWSLANANAPHYARLMLILLFFINLLNYIDRLVISGLLEPIRKDLGLNDAQLGTIALAFLVPYTILPPFVGWIGDRAQRTKLIAGAIGVWSFATAAAGLAVGFRSLVATRVVVGVGESTYMTSAPSLIADTYAPSKRGAAMSLFYTASPIGAGLGVTLGGLIAAAYGWRAACMIVGIPGILLALLLLLAAEARRGKFDPNEAPERPKLKVAFRALIHNRPFLLLVLAYTFQILSYNPIEFWVPTILQRDKGISLAQTSATYGAVVFVAGLLGPIVGGLLGDMLAKTPAHGILLDLGAELNRLRRSASGDRDVAARSATLCLALRRDISRQHEHWASLRNPCRHRHSWSSRNRDSCDVAGDSSAGRWYFTAAHRAHLKSAKPRFAGHELSSARGRLAACACAEPSFACPGRSIATEYCHRRRAYICSPPRAAVARSQALWMR